MNGPGRSTTSSPAAAACFRKDTMSTKPSVTNAPGVGSIIIHGISVCTAFSPIARASASRCAQCAGWMRKCCSEPAKSRMGEPFSRKVPLAPSCMPLLVTAASSSSSCCCCTSASASSSSPSPAPPAPPATAPLSLTHVLQLALAVNGGFSSPTKIQHSFGASCDSSNARQPAAASHLAPHSAIVPLAASRVVQPLGVG